MHYEVPALGITHPHTLVSSMQMAVAICQHEYIIHFTGLALCTFKDTNIFIINSIAGLVFAYCLCTLKTFSKVTGDSLFELC